MTRMPNEEELEQEIQEKENPRKSFQRKLHKVEEEKEKAKADAEHWKNEYFRAYADTQNLRKQLEKDHEYDFGYIYMIERVSNVGFRVVYLNKRTLQPSYCALITYKTSTKPYTKTFSAKLISMPKNIPSITQ